MVLYYYYTGSGRSSARNNARWARWALGAKCSPYTRIGPGHRPSIVTALCIERLVRIRATDALERFCSRDRLDVGRCAVPLSPILCKHINIPQPAGIGSQSSKSLATHLDCKIYIYLSACLVCGGPEDDEVDTMRQSIRYWEMSSQAACIGRAQVRVGIMQIMGLRIVVYTRALAIRRTETGGQPLYYVCNIEARAIEYNTWPPYQAFHRRTRVHDSNHDDDEAYCYCSFCLLLFFVLGLNSLCYGSVLSARSIYGSLSFFEID